MPEAAGGEFVVDRFRGLVSRIAGTVSISGQAQRVFAEYGGKIAGSAGVTGRVALVSRSAAAEQAQQAPDRNGCGIAQFVCAPNRR
jgi:hypothetical protein